MFQLNKKRFLSMVLKESHCIKQSIPRLRMATKHELTAIKRIEHDIHLLLLLLPHQLIPQPDIMRYHVPYSYKTTRVHINIWGSHYDQNDVKKQYQIIKLTQNFAKVLFLIYTSFVVQHLAFPTIFKFSMLNHFLENSSTLLLFNIYLPCIAKTSYF